MSEACRRPPSAERDTRRSEELGNRGGLQVHVALNPARHNRVATGGDPLEREPIEGLYAAGVEGAMLWANVYTINISGACNANSVNSGRGAVRHAAEEYIPSIA